MEKFRKLENLEKYGIIQTNNNTFQNEKLTVQFNTHGGGGESFGVFNLTSVLITYNERLPNMSNHFARSNYKNHHMYRNYDTNRLFNSKIKFQYFDYVNNWPLYKKNPEYRKVVEAEFIDYLLKIFLKKQYLWQDNYRINKIIHDIKTNNKFLLSNINKLNSS